MIKNQRSQDLIWLNLSMVFVGTSGPLGRFIDLPVPLIIALRALFAGAFLVIFCKWKGIDFSVNKKDRGTIAIAGMLLGLHWVTYFYSLKLSNVAIGMLSMFTYPVITALIEPFFLKTKFHVVHLVLAGSVLVGIYFLVPEVDLQNDQVKAVCLGIFSAFCYAFRNMMMKSKINDYHGSSLMMYQLITIALLLSPTYVMLDTSNYVGQLPFIITLAFLTTAVGHTLFLISFNSFSTTTASIMSSTQPIYGIIIGALFLHEYPATSTYIGGSIILLTVAVESIRSFRS